MKVTTFVGTRPEIIRLSRVITVLEQVTEHVLVHTGQNFDWELNGIFFEELGINSPKHFLKAAGKNAAETIGNVIIRADAVLEVEQPDALLILGDTNSCMATIPAKRRKIPIFHMEAGNRCFDQRVPEEINRRIIDHISDINMCYSEHARRNLLTEGLPPDRIIKTGSPMKEILDFYTPAIKSSDVHHRLNLIPGRYFILSIHREENVDCTLHLESLVTAINILAKKYAFPMIFSVHPRTRMRLEESKLVLHKLVHILPPLGFFDYVALQKSAFCTLSDSGTITEEASILGFPAITLREAHERPEGMDEGVVVMTGMNPNRILEAVELTKLQFTAFGPSRMPEDYDVPQLSWKVAKIILGYTEYVNRTVWIRNS